MVFHWSLSDSNSSQVSKRLLTIQANLNNAAVSTVCTCPVISKSSSTCSNLLVTVPKTPITIGVIVTFMFHMFFNSQARSKYFHWSLNKSKYPQVSRTLLSILTVFNNAVVWIVSARPSTFKSSSLFNNASLTVPRAPITIAIIVIFMFHSFFNSQARSRYLSFFSLSFSIILWSAETAKSIILQGLSFCWLL